MSEQETYPQTAPIWFSETDDLAVSAAIEKLCDTPPSNYNICKQMSILLCELCQISGISQPEEIKVIESYLASKGDSMLANITEEDEDSDLVEEDFYYEVDEAQPIENKSTEDSEDSETDRPLTANTPKLSQKVSKNQVSSRLLTELRQIYGSTSFKQGIYDLELVDDNLCEWNIKLKKVDPEGTLHQDMEVRKEKHGLDDILLNFTFKDTYPFEPPFVQLLYPMIASRYVSDQGAISLELLMKQGWNPAYSLESVILQIAAMLAKDLAQIQMDSEELKSKMNLKRKASIDVLKKFDEIVEDEREEKLKKKEEVCSNVPPVAEVCIDDSTKDKPSSTDRSKLTRTAFHVPEYDESVDFTSQTEKVKTRLAPGEILFSQSSISGVFGDGKELAETFQELLDGVKTPDDISAIHVVSWQGKLWALTGHRRLYLYKKLESLGLVKSIPIVLRDIADAQVKSLLVARMTTKTEGKTLAVRESSTDKQLEEFIKEWKSKEVAKQEDGKLNADLGPVDPASLGDKKVLYESSTDDMKFGFLILDDKLALFGNLCGNTQKVLYKIKVQLPIKQADIISDWTEGVHHYMQKVADVAVQLYITNDRSNVEGLILAGSADFMSELSQFDALDMRLRLKVIKIVGVSSGGEEGFKEAIELATDAVSNIRSVEEKKLLGRFFDIMTYESERCCFGVEDTLKALENGTVETLIVWQNLDFTRYVLKNSITSEEKVRHLKPEQEKDKTLFTDQEAQAELEVVSKQPLLKWFYEHCQEFDATLKIIRGESQAGMRFVEVYAGIGGILRDQEDFQSMEPRDDFDADSDLDDN